MKQLKKMIYVETECQEDNPTSSNSDDCESDEDENGNLKGFISDGVENCGALTKRERKALHKTTRAFKGTGIGRQTAISSSCSSSLSSEANTEANVHVHINDVKTAQSKRNRQILHSNSHNCDPANDKGFNDIELAEAENEYENNDLQTHLQDHIDDVHANNAEVCKSFNEGELDSLSDIEMPEPKRSNKLHDHNPFHNDMPEPESLPELVMKPDARVDDESLCNSDKYGFEGDYPNNENVEHSINCKEDRHSCQRLRLIVQTKLENNKLSLYQAFISSDKGHSIYKHTSELSISFGSCLLKCIDKRTKPEMANTQVSAIFDSLIKCTNLQNELQHKRIDALFDLSIQSSMQTVWKDFSEKLVHHITMNSTIHEVIKSKYRYNKCFK